MNINKQTENVSKTSSQDHKITNLNKKSTSKPQGVVKTGNKFLSLSSDVDADMEEDSPPPRSRRSVSPSHRKTKSISPVKYQ